MRCRSPLQASLVDEEAVLNAIRGTSTITNVDADRLPCGVNIDVGGQKHGPGIALSAEVESLVVIIGIVGGIGDWREPTLDSVIFAQLGENNIALTGTGVVG